MFGEDDVSSMNPLSIIGYVQEGSGSELTVVEVRVQVVVGGGSMVG